MRKLFILKGFHYSTFIPRLFCSKNFSRSVSVKFDRSCAYEIEEKSCVNKLWGISFGLFGVHKNSYRFGWTYNKEQDNITIWSYVYNNGKLNKLKLTTCEFDKEYTFSIEITDHVLLSVGGTAIIVSLTGSNQILLELGFYFGGNTRAPHNMSIEIQK